MAERIYVMKDAGNLEPLTEEPFDTEDILQKLIADHPELLDGEQIRPADPRRWLLVTREKGIADGPDAGNRWSVDHLMIDQDAVPTFVEVKRSSNSEIRRSVVGQMLDYAAHAVEIKQFRGADLRTLVPQVIGRTVASDPSPSGGRKRKRLTMEQFCKQLPDQASVHAAKQLIASAEERGAVVNRKESGLTISVQSTLRAAPLTVAWLFPTMSSYWNNLKGFTFGQVNWFELPEEAQVEFDELYRQMSRDGFAEEVGNDKTGGARGWAVDPAVVAQYIGPMKERLTRAIAILQSL